jgi:hypothetical protein
VFQEGLRPVGEEADLPAQREGSFQDRRRFRGGGPFRWRGRNARMLQFRPLPIVASAVAESVGIARFTL